MKIDTQRMRWFVEEKFEKEINGDHYSGCEYRHASCAILELCNELDAANAIVYKMRNHFNPDGLLTDYEILAKFLKVIP